MPNREIIPHRLYGFFFAIMMDNMVVYIIAVRIVCFSDSVRIQFGFVIIFHFSIIKSSISVGMKSISSMIIGAKFKKKIANNMPTAILNANPIVTYSNTLTSASY